jgi:hypothetical protein
MIVGAIVAVATVGILLLAAARVFRRPTHEGILSEIAKDALTKPVLLKKSLADGIFPSLNFSPLTIPRDVNDPNFVKSFQISEKDDFLTFFDAFGFVVIHDVLSKEEIEDSISEIWDIIECRNGARSHDKKNIDILDELHGIKTVLPDRNDSSTWEIKTNGWPPLAHLGILGGAPSFDKQSMKNRFNKNIHSLFATLHGTEDLWVSIDRYGVMRPTKDVLINGEKMDKPTWRTQEKWIHFDQNPKKIGSGLEFFDVRRFHLSTENNDNYTDKVKLQGLVAFLDAREEDGGFYCIPGFHKHIREWADARREYLNDSDFVTIPQNDEILQYAQKIPIRAGSMVVWESSLPHSNFPNSSDRFRMGQYIKMFPARTHAPQKYLDFRKSEILNGLPKGQILSNDQKKLLGLEIEK